MGNLINYWNRLNFPYFLDATDNEVSLNKWLLNDIEGDVNLEDCCIETIATLNKTDYLLQAQKIVNDPCACCTNNKPGAICCCSLCSPIIY